MSNAAPQGTRGKAKPGNGERRRREVLLEAAFRCAVRFGWTRTRMGDVAARAGVSRQTLYFHFQTKDNLAAALALREQDAFLEGYREAFRAQKSVPEGVVAAAAWSLKYAEAHPLLRQLIEDPDSGLLPYVTTRALPLMQRSHRQIVELVNEADPLVDPEMADLLADVLTRMLFSHVLTPSEPVDAVASRLGRLTAQLLGKVERRAPGPLS